MPLLKPDIQKALRSVGLVNDSDLSLQESLEQAGLSRDSLLSELSDFARTSPNESLRLKAIETGLKMHGALKEQPSQIPTINIVIQDPSSTQGLLVNPILVPRSTSQTKESIN